MKRTLAGLFCLCFLLTAVLPQPAHAAGATVVFTAVNDIFTRNLTTATMPVRLDGVMYISYLYLLRLDDLSYNRGDDTLTVLSQTRGLIYDLRTGQVSDLSGQLRPMRGAILRSGSIYLPVEELCDYFDYHCSIITSSGLGEIIRINRQTPVVGDSVVVSANIEVLRQIYVDYQLTAAQEQKPSDPDVPVPPDPGPGTEPDPVTPPARPTRWLYLYFEVTPGAVIDVPTMLEQKGLVGNFFVRPDDILECADYLRRLSIGGHTIGLLAEGDDPAAQLTEGNRLLQAVCLKKTRIAHVTGGTEQTAAALREEGWKLWRWTEDSCFDTQTVAASVIRTMGRLDAVETEAVLRLGCNDAGYQTLIPILYYAESNNYRYRTIRLWTEPLV